MLFEVDQAAIWKSALWTITTVVSLIPWWIWLLLGLAVAVQILKIVLVKR
jgi:hypothetical protein